MDNLFLFSILAADQAIPQGITMQNQHGFNEIILFYIYVFLLYDSHSAARGWALRGRQKF